MNDPEKQWQKHDDETLNNLLNYQHYLVYSEDNDEYSVDDGLMIKMYFFLEKKFSHVKEIEGRPSGACHRTAKRGGGEALKILIKCL